MKSKVEVEAPAPIPPITEKPEVEVKKTPRESEWYDDWVEKNFGRLGRAAAIIFFVGIGIGFLGLFYKCDCISDPSFYDFYYQKFL